MTKRKFILLFLIPYIFMILSLLFTAYLSPLISRDIASQRELVPSEFPFRFDVPEIKKIFIPEVLRSPIKIAKKEFPKISLKELAPPPGITPEITLIVIGDDLRLAIINGLVLKEGDTFGNGRVIKIRQDAVVISEGGRTQEIGVPDR
ncbi:MAG: hypothetical protein ACK4TF_03985 [Thermodesulfovibrionales bacterium]